ncbi:hypothetical protein SSS_00043 [Sarcoptes scabiei]|uniref:Uncharacterized protein n=1 Tax=Sarcoptes scabiei TaxID=52283 RepID=A0A834R6A1_SARSC|nr:hypothetical protein SSS_00043 [Sarcoptes scabiei]
MTDLLPAMKTASTAIPSTVSTMTIGKKISNEIDSNLYAKLNNNNGVNSHRNSNNDDNSNRNFLMASYLSSLLQKHQNHFTTKQSSPSLSSSSSPSPSPSSPLLQSMVTVSTDSFRSESLLLSASRNKSSSTSSIVVQDANKKNGLRNNLNEFQSRKQIKQIDPKQQQQLDRLAKNFEIYFDNQNQNDPRLAIRTIEFVPKATTFGPYAAKIGKSIQQLSNSAQCFKVTDRSGSFSAWIELKDIEIYQYFSLIRRLDSSFSEQSNGDDFDRIRGNKSMNETNKKCNNDLEHHREVKGTKFRESKTINNEMVDFEMKTEANSALLFFCGHIYLEVTRDLARGQELVLNSNQVLLIHENDVCYQDGTSHYRYGTGLISSIKNGQSDRLRSSSSDTFLEPSSLSSSPLSSSTSSLTTATTTTTTTASTIARTTTPTLSSSLFLLENSKKYRWKNFESNPNKTNRTKQFQREDFDRDQNECFDWKRKNFHDRRRKFRSLR